MLAAKLVGRFAPIALLLTCTSCVEFDGQKISYRYDADRDELRIFNVYERVFAEGDRDGWLTRQERQQLMRVLYDREVFFFDNNLSISKGEIRREIEDRHGRQTNQPPSLETLRLLQENVHVEQGEAYLNEDRDLCFYQTIVISNVSKLVDAVNRDVNDTIKKDYIDSSQLEKFDEASQQKIRQQFADGHWLKLDGQQIVIRAPMRTTDFERELGQTDVMQELVDGGLLAYNEPFFELTLGKPDDARVQFGSNDLQKRDYNTLVIEYLLDMNVEIRDKLDVDAAGDKFFETGQRTQEN